MEIAYRRSAASLILAPSFVVLNPYNTPHYAFLMSLFYSFLEIFYG